MCWYVGELVEFFIYFAITKNYFAVVMWLTFDTCKFCHFYSLSQPYYVYFNGDSSENYSASVIALAIEIFNV